MKIPNNKFQITNKLQITNKTYKFEARNSKQIQNSNVLNSKGFEF